MKVSVAIRTYNQEEFIVQAINSVLMQKVNFDYEIVVADDASTDRTQEILRSFEKEQRGKFRLLLREKNLGRKDNLIDMLRSCPIADGGGAVAMGQLSQRVHGGVGLRGAGPRDLRGRHG